MRFQRFFLVTCLTTAYWVSEINKDDTTDIDNDVIYTNDCWDICKELAELTEWDKMELGPITSLQQLAYISLYEFANDNLDLEELLNETINENA